MPNRIFESDNESSTTKKPRIGCFSMGIYIVSGLWFLLGVVFLFTAPNSDTETSVVFGGFLIFFCLPAAILSVICLAVSRSRKTGGTNRGKQAGNKTSKTRLRYSPDTAEQVVDAVDKLRMASKVLRAYGDLERPSNDQAFQAAKALFQIIKKK